MDKKLEDKEEIIEKSIENNVNYGNLEEKKKTGFFSMLSNLMKSDIKTSEVNDKSHEKKPKSKKIKTDPNLFLFSDVLDEQSNLSNETSSETDNTEISEISEFTGKNENIEDIDTPSYLRKGSNQ